MVLSIEPSVERIRSPAVFVSLSVWQARTAGSTVPVSWLLFFFSSCNKRPFSFLNFIALFEWRSSARHYSGPIVKGKRKNDSNNKDWLCHVLHRIVPFIFLSLPFFSSLCFSHHRSLLHFLRDYFFLLFIFLKAHLKPFLIGKISSFVEDR